MTSETFLDGRVTLHLGDCLDVLKGMEADSVDSVVCDPPYHLTSIVKRFGADGAAEAKEGETGGFKRASSGFMGKQWDGGDIAFKPDVWRECLRVLKPGGYILAFASTRGIWRMGVAIEDAGFIPHPMIGWLFGSGFPKATRIKAEGYDGFRYGGQSLKPAIEPIFMGQKPFEKGLSGTQNILQHGTGAINVDAARIEAADGTTTARKPAIVNDTQTAFGKGTAMGGNGSPLGRWPANLIHDGSEEVLAGFPETGVSSGGSGDASIKSANQTFSNKGTNLHGGANFGGLGDSGSAARFFYSAKADSDDRLGSKHPTVKPIDLMQYLVRLVTPPGGTVLDPFAGTGTTGEAAWREGFNAVLIEREEEYQNDIRERMRLCLSGPDERRRETIKRKGTVEDAGPLFVGSAA